MRGGHKTLDDSGLRRLAAGHSLGWADRVPVPFHSHWEPAASFTVSADGMNVRPAFSGIGSADFGYFSPGESRSFRISFPRPYALAAFSFRMNRTNRAYQAYGFGNDYSRPVHVSLMGSDDSRSWRMLGEVTTAWENGPDAAENDCILCRSKSSWTGPVPLPATIVADWGNEGEFKEYLITFTAVDGDGSFANLLILDCRLYLDRDTRCPLHFWDFGDGLALDHLNVAPSAIGGRIEFSDGAALSTDGPGYESAISVPGRCLMGGCGVPGGCSVGVSAVPDWNYAGSHPGEWFALWNCGVGNNEFIALAFGCPDGENRKIRLIYGYRHMLYGDCEYAEAEAGDGGISILSAISWGAPNEWPNYVRPSFRLYLDGAETVSFDSSSHRTNSGMLIGRGDFTVGCASYNGERFAWAMNTRVDHLSIYPYAASSREAGLESRI